MARTIIEISNELKANFVINSTIQQFYSLTPGLTFDDQFSKVSLEGILFYCLSFSIWILEKLFDDHKIWIEARAKELILGNTAWYRKIALLFQYGDPLVFIDDVYIYETINESNKIVRLCSVTDEGSQMLMKVANLDSGANIIPLTSGQLASFSAYIKKMKFAGVKIIIVSREADLVKIYMHLFIDSLVLSADGTLLSDGITKPVEDTINNYIKNLPFNGKFNPNELVDYLQQTVGVIDPFFDSASAKFGTGSYAPIVNYYNPNAGYLAIDTDFPLSTTISYALA